MFFPATITCGRFFIMKITLDQIKLKILEHYGIDDLQGHDKNYYAAKKLFIKCALDNSYTEEQIARYLGETQQNINYHKNDLMFRIPNEAIKYGLQAIEG